MQSEQSIRFIRQWSLAILMLLVALSACSSNSGRSPTPTPVQTSPSSVIQLGVQPCPDAVNSPAHWGSIVGLTPSQTVEGVICGYLMGISTLQAVVKVRSGGTDRLLDVAVYTAITTANPSRVFSLKGLEYGDVTISNYNTVLTKQADPNAAQSQTQHDLYREFKWSDSAGTFSQASFVGLYPDLTRYEAEFEQDQVNTGQGLQQWRLSAVTTAQNFAEFILGWEHAAPATIVSGGGTNDANAVVQILNPQAANATIKVSLSRLEFNTNGGIWEVTDVATDGIKLTSPQNAQQVTNPVQVIGDNTAFAGQRAVLQILDQTHTQVSQLISVTGESHLSASVSYTSNFQGVAQEGIVALYIYNGNQMIIGATMVKVLLSA